MKHIIVLHPFFFILYTVLFLLSQNIEQVSFSQIYRSLVVLVIFTGIILIGLRLVLRNWQRAGLVTTLALLIFMSFGHVRQSLLSQYPAIASVIRLRTMLAIAVLLFLAGSAWIVFRLKNPVPITRILNAMCAFLLLIPGFNVVQYSLNHPKTEKKQESSPLLIKQGEAVSPAGNLASDMHDRPDIYYIILDGFAQESVLEDIYSFDNSSFIDQLKKAGFYVAEESHSNYNQTLLSLPSSLNFDYLQSIDPTDPKKTDRGDLVHLLHNSKVVMQLKENGYRTIAVSTGFEWTEMTEADSYIDIHDLNQFESMEISNTAAQFAVYDAQLAMRRLSIIDRFKGVGDVAAEAGPKFVFAHMVVPHPPFLFNQNGSPVKPDNLLLNDGNSSGLEPKEYTRLYSNQAGFISSLTIQMIKSILANSKTDPIIIIQGDHGPGAYLNWSSANKSCIRERMSILNAYHLPGGKTPAQVGLYPDVTPVNSFRLIFNAYLGTHYDILADRSYFSTWAYPFAFYDVSQQLATCSPLDK
jgi:hypothetical protein